MKVGALLLVFIFAPLLRAEEAPTFSSSIHYNPYPLINGKGELATSSQFLQGGQLQSEVTIKTGRDLTQTGRAHRYPVTLPTGFDTFRAVDFTDSGELLVRLIAPQASDGSQDKAGFAVWRNGALTQLNAGKTFTYAADLAEDGTVVGSHVVNGLRDLPGGTTVPIFVTADGSVTEIPHANGGAYGYELGANASVIARDNAGSAAAINSNGEILVNYIDAGPDGYIKGFNTRSLLYPAIYRIGTGVVRRIPALEQSGSLVATDINDLGEIVGYRFPSEATWLYLPTANYGLSGGLHFIRDRPSSGSLESPKINNDGLVIWPDNFSNVPSLTVWCRGEFVDVGAMQVSSNNFVLKAVTNFNELGQLLVYGDTTSGASAGFTGSRIFTNTAGVFRMTIPEQAVFEKDVPMEVKLEVRTTRPEPTTIIFPNGLLETTGVSFAGIPTDVIEPFVLSAEDPSRIFVFTVTPTGYGAGQLSSRITRSSVDGMETVSVTKDIVVSPLKITVQMKPLVDGKPIVNLELTEDLVVTDEDGHAVTPLVEVTVENLADETVTARLQGVDPRARDRSSVNGRIRTVGTFPIDLGTITKGTPVKREIALKIDEDGRFDFKALVTATLTGTAGQFNVSKQGAPIAVGEPYPVEIEMKFVRTPAITNQNNGSFFMQPGSSLQIIATVNNLTSNRTLEFFGIKSRSDRNALGGVLTTPQGRQVSPPFAYVHEIREGGGKVLAGDILTQSDGAPSGSLTWDFAEGAVLKDNLTENLTLLTEDDILVTSTPGDWLNDDLTVRLIQDYGRPPRDDINAFAEAAYIGVGALKGMRNWTFEGLAAVGKTGALPIRIVQDPSLLADALGEASVTMWELAEMASKTWDHMTPEQREAMLENVAREVLRRAYLLGTTRSPIDIENDAEAFQNALNYTREAIYPLFSGVTEAYATDDPRIIADLQGRVSGHIAMEVLFALIPTPQFTSFTKGAEAAQLVRTTSLGESLNIQEAFLRSVPSGLVKESTTIKHWGFGGKNMRDIQEVFDLFKVKGYLRERSPRAFQLIDVLQEAIWKPEAMKPKGIIDLDLLLLGDNADLIRLAGKEPGGLEIGLDGITAIFKPEDTIPLRNRLRMKGISEEVIAAAEARAKLRRGEFEDYLPEFELWKLPINEGGGIPVGKNYLDNGVPNVPGQERVKRKFDYQRIAREGQPTIYIPKMANEDGLFRYISGDIDWVHFSFLNGQALDSGTAYRLYEALSLCCGLQHPETISWIRNGQTVFKAKIAQIGEYLNGGKALLEVTGAETRAVRINKNLTRFANEGRGHRIYFDGGVKSRVEATLTDIESAIAYVQNKYPDRRLLTPSLWFVRPGEEEGGSLINGSDWSFSTAPGSSLARQGTDGRVERLAPTGNWVPWDFSASSGKLSLSPATAISSSLAPGTSQVPIMDLPVLWSQQLEGHVEQWFEIGQTIVIAPGTAAQEIRVVQGLRPLALDRPLEFEHPEGTLVAVLPPSLESLQDSDGDSYSDAAELVLGTDPHDASSYFQISSVARVPDGDMVVLTWPRVTGATAILETSRDLSVGSWHRIETSQSLEGAVVRSVVASGDETRFFRVRFEFEGEVTLDSDGDGYSDVIEIALGTDPNNASSFFQITSLERSSDARSTVLTWPTVSGPSVILESSTNLASGSWRPVTASLLTQGAQTRATVENDDPTRFFRVRFE